MTRASTCPAIEATGLAVRYGRRWALNECDLSLPAGSVVGLVGPNGSGKTSLLHVAAGLLPPTSGSMRVLGRAPADPEVIARIGFVAQDKPLYERFTVAETLRMGGWLNPNWERDRAHAHVARFDIPLNQRVGTLSGGQRAQVALALALGKRPDLLLLDEPVANLDPLARRQFLQALMEHTAEYGMTVVLSSHLLSDLDRVCDHMILLSSARVQLSGAVEELLDSHRIVVGPPSRIAVLASSHVMVESSETERQAIAVVRGKAQIHDPAVNMRPMELEELVLAYMNNPMAGATSALRLIDA
jgi:ABC-2 type transport system ATP-binding protein